jgi:hypothetical protein
VGLAGVAPLIDPAWLVDQQQCFGAGRQAGTISSSRKLAFRLDF